MAQPRLQFWFEFASTYSYLTAMRIEAVAAADDITVEWRPFLLGPIFAAQGWRDSPFNLYPAKGRYMWRDMERSCERYGLPLRRPSTFPRNGLLAARVALVGAHEPWGPGFVRSVYNANFAQDLDIGDAAVIEALLNAMGLPSGAILERAQAADTKDRLRRQTEHALELGIFGAPSLVVGSEVFWGNDRLEDALAWARHNQRPLASSP